MKQFYLFMFAVFFFGISNAQVKIGTTNYPTLRAAVTAVNQNLYPGDVVIEITGNTVETASVTISPSAANSILIKPTLGSAKSIVFVGDIFGLFIKSANVTIDGLNLLTIAHSWLGATTIYAYEDIRNSSIRNCAVKGSATNSIIAISTIFGNDLMIPVNSPTFTVSNCDIGPYDSNLPSIGITASMTRRSQLNIDGNRIHDYIGTVSAGKAAIVASVYGCTISNNKIYQSVPRSVNLEGISVSRKVLSFQGDYGVVTISGNDIGSANAMGTGNTTINNANFLGIFSYSDSDSATYGKTVIENNTIHNISVSGNIPNVSGFVGIQVNSGVHVIQNNNIGSQTSNGNITFNGSGNGLTVRGIVRVSSSSGDISGNTIGGIDVTGNAAIDFMGIEVQHSSTFGFEHIDNNIIGGSVSNSISFNAPNGSNAMRGISNSDTMGIGGNTIRNMTTNNWGNGSERFVGIASFLPNGNNGDFSIHDNKIYNLVNTNASQPVSMNGIYCTGSYSTSIHRNEIYHLNAVSTNSSSIITGIGTENSVTMQNNMISLGYFVTADAAIYGIKGVGSNITSNSVFICGDKGYGASPSAAMVINTSYCITSNNILVNNRSNYGTATAVHYSLQYSASSSNINYNGMLYFGNGNGYKLATVNGVAVTTVLQLNSYAVGGGSGYFSDPNFIAPNDFMPNLHISPTRQTMVEGRGFDNVAFDIDSQTRSELTPTDIGADAGNFVAMVNPPTIANFSNMALCTYGNFTITGTNLSGVHEARIGTTVLPIFTATNTTILISTGTTPVSGTLKLTNAIGAAVSVGTITINTRPLITTQPQSITTCAGLSTFSVTAANVSAYQWRRNGIALVNNSNYNGVTTATLTVNNPAPNSADVYDVVVTGTGGCSMTSFPATLTVGGQVVELVSSGPTTFCNGEFTQLTPKVHVPALQFDGSDDYVNFYGSNYLDFTMGFWMKTTQTGNTGSQWYEGTGIVDGLQFVDRNFGTALVGDKLAFGVKVSEYGGTVLSNTPVNTGEWTYVTVTRSQTTSQLRIYLNGVLDASGFSNDGGFELANQAMRVGGLFQGGSYFNGAIDDVRIWKRILSDAEIFYLTQGGDVINNLSVKLPMDENSGTQTVNTQNNESFTIMNGAQWTDRLAPAIFANPVWSNGQNSQNLGVTTSGNYSFTGNYGTCTLPLVSNTVTINVLSPQVHLATSSDNLFYCGGYPVQLQGVGAANYTWSPAEGLSNTTGEYVYATPTATTNYTLQGTDENGCTGSYSFTVFVQQSAAIAIDGNTDNSTVKYILPGQSVLLTASGGSGNYTWSPSEGLNQATGQTVVASPTESTSYSVNGIGCDIAQYATVYVLPQPSQTDNALDFDGVDDQVEVLVPNQTVSGTFTVAFWVKPTNPTKTMRIFSTQYGAHFAAFDLQIKDGNRIHASIGNGTEWLTTQADAFFPYEVNQWMHIAYKITPGQYKIFVNGNLVQTGNFTGSALLYDDTTNYMTIGGDINEDSMFQGTLDDLLISTFDFPDEFMTNAPRFGIPAQIRYTFDEGIAGGYNPTVTLLANQDTQSTMHGFLNYFTLNGDSSNWVVGQSVQQQTISMAAQNSIVYGTSYNPAATTSSGLPVNYVSSDPSIAEVSGNMVLIHNIGTVTIVARQDGNAFYDQAEPKMQQLTITRKPLTLSNAVAQNKVYDRNTSAIIDGVLSGIVGTDLVSFTGTGSFAFGNVANGIGVNPAVVLSGADASKYTMQQPAGLSANITPKPLTVSGAVANNKYFDGTTAATISGASLIGIISPDQVTIASNAGTFASSVVGNNIAVTSQLTLGGTSAGNYMITQPTGLTANIMQSLLTATISGTATICAGQQTYLQVAINDPGIFTVKFTNGTVIYTANNYSSGYNLPVAPVSTSTYTLVSVTGNSAPVSVSGSATITVNPNVTYFADSDGDGFGNASVTQSTCIQPIGYVTNNTDCNDSDATAHQTFQLYVDADYDSFGTGSSVAVCTASGTTAPTGYSLSNTDCNDNDAAVNQTFQFYFDADHDTYGTGNLVSVCTASGTIAPTGYSLNNTDCNDNDAAVHQTFQFYVDADHDTYGTGNLVSVCTSSGTIAPTGYSLNNTDCNDNDVTVYQTFQCYVDADHDSYGAGNLVAVCTASGTTVPMGYSLNNTDCNDADNTVFRSATFFVDADNDGYTTGATAVVCYGNTNPSGYAVSNIGIDCNDSVAVIHPNAAEIGYDGIDNNCNGLIDEGFPQITTSLLASDCNSTLASIGSLIGITTVAPGSIYTGYRIRATNGAQVQVIERNVPHFTMQEFPSYAYATTYTIDIQLQRNGVWLGYYGPTCQVSTPAILAENGAAQVSPSQCGITLPKINTLIATTSLAGVTGYRFRVTNLTDVAGPNAVQTIDRTQNWFSLQMLTRYNYGTTYRIEVSVKSGTGAFGGFGSPCEVSSPPAPSLVNCGGVVASGTAYISATSLSGVTQYRFQINRQSDLASATIDRNTNFFTFNSVPAAVSSPGVLYAVRVAVYTAGTWSPFGDACEITSPGTAARYTPTAPAESTAFKATAYPNPFASEFAIDVTTSSDANVQVKVYDMLGKLIESREVKLSELDVQKVGDRYPSGVYNVIVSQGGIVKTLRVIKR